MLKRNCIGTPKTLGGPLEIPSLPQHSHPSQNDKFEIPEPAIELEHVKQSPFGGPFEVSKVPICATHAEADLRKMRPERRLDGCQARSHRGGGIVGGQVEHALDGAEVDPK